MSQILYLGPSFFLSYVIEKVSKIFMTIYFQRWPVEYLYTWSKLPPTAFTNRATQRQASPTAPAESIYGYVGIVIHNISLSQ